MANRPRLLYAVTAARSNLLLVGQREYMRDKGFDVEMISAPGEELDEVARSGFRTFAIPFEREIAPVADLRCLIRAVSLLRQRRPTITNASTPKAGLLLGLAAVLAGVRCRIFTLRGLRSQTGSGWKRRIVRFTERISCWCAHRVVCVSPSLAAEAVRQGIVGGRKVRVISSSNGVDVSRFRPVSEDDRSRRKIELGLPAHLPVIVFCGRFTVDKGLVELIEASEKLRKAGLDFRLQLLGDFEPADRPPASTCEKIANAAWIRNAGNVPDTTQYYKAADVVVLPTYREGFPNVVLEAQAMAIPVVTTTATGAVDSVEDGETGLLVPAGDRDALAKAISLLLRDPALRKKIGTAGRARVEKFFRREFVWEQLHALFVELMADSNVAERAVQPAASVAGDPACR